MADIVHLPIRDDWFDEKFGFPRPKWGAIHGWMRVYAQENPDTAWEEFGRLWMRRLQQALGGGYIVDESKNFLLLSEADTSTRNSRLTFAESVRGHILTVLGKLSQQASHGKHVMLYFSDADDYDAYTAHFSGVGEFAGSSGCFIPDQYRHIAIHSVFPSEDRATAAHEIAHDLLSDLPLPGWLNEALAMAFENDLAGTPAHNGVIDTIDRHREYWDADTIQEFWRGRSFSNVEAQDLSYNLAAILLHLIHADLRPSPDNFRKFVQRSDWGDAGEIAAQEHLGIGLSDMVARFLGPGDWSPKPEKWKAEGSSMDDSAAT